MTNKHLYRYGGKKAHLPEFRRRYGSRALEVYGKVVGKVKREQLAKKKKHSIADHFRSHGY